MAAGQFEIYHNGLLNLLKGLIAFETDTIKAALLLATYTKDLALHDFLDDVVAHECADGDYARLTLGTKTVALAAGKVRFDAADLDFGNGVTITAKHLVIFKDTAVAATSPLLFICDLNTGGGSASSTASDYDLAINASGIYEDTPNV